MTRFHLAGFGNSAASLSVCVQSRYIRAQAFSSRKNGQALRRPTPPTQLAAIQVLDPEEELVGTRHAESEPEFEDDDPSPPGLSTQQVQTLLSVICKETELAELELKIGSFDLKVRRSLATDVSNSQRNNAGMPTIYGSPFVSTASMDQGDWNPPFQPPAQESQASVDEEDVQDESHIVVESHKVGLMRRARYVKGKKVGKGPIAEVGTILKKGQIVCFIEQLGTFEPIEAQQPGEIVEFLCEEGSPVEYKQPLAEVAPFFGGHIIGDKKNA